MNRRDLLGSIGTTSVALLTGCGSDGPGPTAGSPTMSVTDGHPAVLRVATGETHVVATGTTETYRHAEIEGQLAVDGTLVVTG